VRQDVSQMPLARQFVFSSVFPQDFVDWSAQQDVFAGMAATALSGDFVDQEGPEPTAIKVNRVSSGFFTLLGIVPALGRAFSTEDEVVRDPHVTVISDAFWRRRFGADPTIVGRMLRLDNGEWQIEGVMPAEFADPFGGGFRDVLGSSVDMWVPYVVPAAERIRGNDHNSYLKVIARLKPGVTVSRAQARMAQISAGLMSMYPSWYSYGGHAMVYPLANWTIGSAVKSWMLMLLGAAGCVLLIACVNVANLLLARATSRSHEIGIRAALGADRWRLARGLLVESVLLSAAGTGLATLVAYWLVGLLRAGLPPGVPRAAMIAVNGRVLWAAVAAAGTTGIGFGLFPAFAVSGPSVMGGLRASGPRTGTASPTRQRLRSVLVVGEVALAVALVVGAGLFSASFVHLMSVDIGIDYHGVLTASVVPTTSGATPQQRSAAGIQQMEDVVRRVGALPGVTAAGALAGALPFSGNVSRVSVEVPGRGEFKGDDGPDRYFVTAGYLHALRLPLIRGRLFTETDDRAEGELLVLLNQTAARRYFGDTDPLGQAVEMSGQRRVLGIVGDMRPLGPETPTRPEAYAPLTQGDRAFGWIVIRSAGDPASLTAAVKAIVAGVMPHRVVPAPVLLENLFAPLVAQRRFNMLLVGLFGLLAMAIAVAGLYGVMSYLVAQRTQEIGVRIALGAAPGRVVGMMLKRALGLLATGLALGLGLAWEGASVVRSFLFEVSPHNASVYTGVTVLLLLAGLGAAYFPARRAAGVDPLVALRNE
jgi:putative ABC transport system permease protein